MRNPPEFIITLARLALGAGLLSAVADRLGLWGSSGQPHIALGNWTNFVAYTAQVNSFLPAALAPALAGLATTAEVVLGTCLVLGLGTRWAAWGAGLLTLLFALAMTLSFGPKVPLDYSVWTNVAAGLLLAQAPGYTWSLDAWWAKQHPQRPPSTL
jgi:putative oxidoreductase